MTYQITKLSLKAIVASCAMLTLAACGGGGADDSTNGPSFGPGPARVEVTLDPESARIPLNPGYSTPTKGSPYTVAIGVTSYRGDVVTTPEQTNIALSTSTSIGSLYYMDTEHVMECPEEEEPCPQQPFRNLVFDNMQVATGYFYAQAGGKGGVQKVVVTTIFEDEASAQSTFEITVGSTTSFPVAGEYLIDTTVGLSELSAGTLQVYDSNRAPVVGSDSYDSVEFVVDSVSYQNGGRVSAVGYDGQSVMGQSATATTVQNGQANFSILAPRTAGTMTVSLYVDVSDNNVSNGYTNQVLLGTIVFTVVDDAVATTDDVERLTFTGSFASNALAGENYSPITTGEDSLVTSGGLSTYGRTIGILATDANGRPAGVGNKVQFYLVDGPLKGYPDQGHGSFIHSGIYGNPQGSSSVAGSNLFTSLDPVTSIDDPSYPSEPVLAGCRLMFGQGIGDYSSIPDSSYTPFERGVRTLVAAPILPSSGVPSQSDPIRMTTDRAFNPYLDTGFTVPWIIGCGGSFGSIVNADGATIDANGQAGAILQYPADQVGRSFVLIAEYTRDDGQIVSAVLDHWYLASTATVNLEIDPNTTQTVPDSLGTTYDITPIKLTLTGDNNAALMNTVLECTTRMTREPAVNPLTVAQAQLDAAEAALQACLAGGGTCTQEQTDVTAATNDVATAATIVSQWLYAARITPYPLVTDAAGEVEFTLTLEGWPSDSQGELSCSTVNANALNVSQSVSLTFEVQ